MIMGDEQKIIEEVISGQSRSFRILVERYQNPVFRVILKIVADSEDARELTQDVFVKAYESLLQYKPEYKFFSWIYRIAINSALLFVKRRQKLIKTQKMMQKTFQVADQKEDNQHRDYLLNLSLQELSGNYQSVIILKYYADLSYADISETLGISEKKVKSRLFDARILLKEKLSESGFFFSIQDN
jgi:RNA polymerase sigma-70 factor (ECF subfamily)